jgi:hypothetical protein
MYETRRFRRLLRYEIFFEKRASEKELVKYLLFIFDKLKYYRKNSLTV